MSEGVYSYEQRYVDIQDTQVSNSSHLDVQVLHGPHEAVPEKRTIYSCTFIGEELCNSILPESTK